MAPHFFVEDLSVTSIAAIKRNYDAGALRERLARHHANVEIAFHGWAGAWLDPRFRTGFDISDDVARIAVPLLILQGTDDRYGTDAHARLAERVMSCPMRTILLPAGHSPHVEAAEQSVAAITEFVQTLGLATRE